MVEDRPGIGTGIETLDGVALQGEVLAVIGAGIRMAPHRYLVVGDGVEVLDGEGTERGIARMIPGGYRRLEGTAILRLPGVVDVVGGTAGEVGEDQGTRDLAVLLAETPDMIESFPDTLASTGEGIM